VKRGEVRSAQHPDWPRRPALALTRNEAIARADSQRGDRSSGRGVRRARDHDVRALPTEVEPGPADGMPGACVLNADHVASLPKGYLGDLITALSAEKLAAICRALDHASGW
jgi:mRNA-degrading endonuclease toxin of MazEF toxin-antitoxin module